MWPMEGFGVWLWAFPSFFFICLCLANFILYNKICQPVISLVVYINLCFTKKLPHYINWNINIKYHSSFPLTVMKIVYGPIASWRLGRSLGVDLICSTEKICSFDCIYCQLEKTKHITSQRNTFVSINRVEMELKSALKLKEISPQMNVFIVYRSMRPYGLREDLYREARNKGIAFIRYDHEKGLEVDSFFPV